MIGQVVPGKDYERIKGELEALSKVCEEMMVDRGECETACDDHYYRGREDVIATIEGLVVGGLSSSAQRRLVRILRGPSTSNTSEKGA